MGETRYLLKEIGDTKGKFHAKMCTIKERNCKDPTETEAIKRRWQEYTELYKKGLYDPDNHNGVATHLEHSPVVTSYPGVWSQVGLRKHYYKQS